jgi:hypothetical protein
MLRTFDSWVILPASSSRSGLPDLIPDNSQQPIYCSQYDVSNQFRSPQWEFRTDRAFFHYKQSSEGWCRRVECPLRHMDASTRFVQWHCVQRIPYIQVIRLRPKRLVLMTFHNDQHGFQTNTVYKKAPVHSLNTASIHYPRP